LCHGGLADFERPAAQARTALLAVQAVWVELYTEHGGYQKRASSTSGRR
jgi:hypothetical protein